MRMTVATVGTVLGLTFSTIALAESVGLVEFKIEELFRASFVTVASGQTVAVTTGEGENRTLLMTSSLADDKRLGLTVIDALRPSPPLFDREVVLGEPVDLVFGGASLRFTAVAIAPSNVLSSALGNTMKSKALPPDFGLYELCCLQVGDGRRCGCRVRVGSNCCAEPPCSCNGQEY